MAVFIFMYYSGRAWTLPLLPLRPANGPLLEGIPAYYLPLNILVIAVLKLLFFRAGGRPGDIQRHLLAYLDSYRAYFRSGCARGLLAPRQSCWFGKAERPVLVERPLILVRTTHGGRGTIEGEARPVEVTRSSGG